MTRELTFIYNVSLVYGVGLLLQYKIYIYFLAVYNRAYNITVTAGKRHILSFSVFYIFFHIIRTPN